MGVVRDVNLIFLIGLLVSFLGFLLQAIGMATTRWSYRTDPDFEYGVFRYCVGQTCSYYSNTNSDQEASQALTIIGAMFCVIALVVACVHLAMTVFRRYFEALPIAAFICSACSCISIILGVIVWAATSHDDYKAVSSDYDLGWSFVVSAVAGCLIGVSGVLFLLGKD